MTKKKKRLDLLPLTPEQQDIVAQFQRDYVSPVQLLRKVSEPTYWMAKKSGMDDDDVQQAAYHGIVEAARRFDPDLGFKFSTYAAFWMRQKVQEHRKIWMRNHFDPETKLPPISVGAIRDESGKEFFESTIASPSEDKSVERTESDRKQMEDVVRRGMRNIRGRSREILMHRFQLGGRDHMTLDELAVWFRVSKERVRQLESEGRYELMRALSEAGYETYESVFDRSV